MRAFIILSLFWPVYMLAARPVAKDVLKCSSAARARKDCHLRLQKTKIQVWQDKIFINNLVERSQLTLPEAGDAVEWGKVELHTSGQKLYLQMLYWGAPQTDVELSQKKWLVYEITGVQAKLIHEQVVQRRRKTDKGYEKDKEIQHSIEKLIQDRRRRTTHEIPTH